MQELKLPENSNLPKDQQHFLAYIPWDDKYLQNVPGLYREKFKECLPYLSVRTTDVHVSICFTYFHALISNFERSSGTKVDKDVVAYALMLHDIGWSQLTEEEVAASLGIKGLKLNETALGPKEKHAVVGEQLAKRFLKEWNIDEERSALVCECVRWHDQPEKVSTNGEMAPEIQVLVDLDHIWSFTRKNFWQDTYRKGVDPHEYAKNLKNDLNSYFVTDAGRELANQLLREREAETALGYNLKV